MTQHVLTSSVKNDFRWLELYAKLSELWKSCHVADAERVIPSNKHTEKDFINMSTEISRLESLYAARKDVFDVLTKWKDTWANKIALEEKRKTADYYQNRGRENNVFLDAKVKYQRCCESKVWNFYSLISENDMQRMASSSSLRTPQSSQGRLPPRAVSSSKLGLVRKVCFSSCLILLNDYPEVFL
ncbi:unnamed protein product [Angiostrongylus costaricensis]|uniref:FRIGIDA-like protein n=1 Tax=Angiostrongylus costaricensis TaxID=334426 RepID=A0A0R3PM62_ANGCS|nr:unnamed protein product [Angiostrongylus costaricensis]